MTKRYQKLTSASIKKLKIGEKITERGITAVCTKDGDIKYEVGVSVDGQRIHRVIGSKADGTTLTQAEDFISRVRSEARTGRLNLPAGRKIELTFKAGAELYLNMQREIDGANLTNKEQHIRLHLVPELGSLPIDKISTFTLKALRKKLLAKGLTQATANRIFATYRHITNSLFEWGKIKSPATMIKLVREDNQREYVLSDIQKRDLLGAAGDDSNSFIQLFIQVGLNTSLRHSEILSLRFDQFDHERKTIRVQVKGGSWRNQPMTPTLARILNHERIMANDPEGWIFPNPNSASGHYQSMKAPFRRAVVAAGLNPALVTPHTMRHTAITDIAETGASDRTVQAFSGHQSKEMVWRYTHARDEKVDEALQKLDEANTNEEQILAFRPKSL